MTEQLDDLSALTAEDFGLDPEAALLPEITTLPPKPPEQIQDIFEGFGGPGSPGTVPPQQAVKAIVDDIKHDRGWPVGYCLQYQRIKRGVNAKYQSAKESLWAADVKHKITDWAKVPRGVIVYFDSATSKYGHITTSFGGGWIGSTDWPTGKIGRVMGETLRQAWGYTAAYWSPIVNDVRVWSPKAAVLEPTPPTKPPEKDDKSKTPRISAVIGELAEIRKSKRQAGYDKAANTLTDAIRILVELERKD